MSRVSLILECVAYPEFCRYGKSEGGGYSCLKIWAISSDLNVRRIVVSEIYTSWCYKFSSLEESKEKNSEKQRCIVALRFWALLVVDTVQEFSVALTRPWLVPETYPRCVSSTNEPWLKEKSAVKTVSCKYLAERKRFYPNYAKYLDLFYRCNSFVLHQ